MNTLPSSPGKIALFGSGETAPSSQKIYDLVWRDLPTPLLSSILETPAGFEPNSAAVAGRVADFLTDHLPNYDPTITIVPARKRDTPFSPDALEILTPLLTAVHIHLGAGSPTYTVRQLQESVAWQLLRARHHMGAVLTLASAATLAVSAYTLPVYEIYKVGDDLHWQTGLDLFGDYGLPSLAIVPHWDNQEGGAFLDTSRCYMGGDRFSQLLALLPPEAVVVGLDEHTGLIFDFAAQRCLVRGKGQVTIMRGGAIQQFADRAWFGFEVLGSYRRPPLRELITADLQAHITTAVAQQSAIPPEIEQLAAQRTAAREARAWAKADELRDQINQAGWEIRDTPTGAELTPK